MDNLHQQMLNAALQNDLNTVEKLVSQGADINYNDKWGNCAIFSAAWNGDIKALDMFYSLGAIIDPGAKNLLCNAALMRRWNPLNGSYKRDKIQIIHWKQAKMPCIIPFPARAACMKDLKL